MDNFIYLDNAATTKPTSAALEKFLKIENSFWGNASSLHEMGVLAEEEFKKAKITVAKSLNAKPDNIYFTSGGTEGNNTAIFGAALKNKNKLRHIVTTNMEHPSVLMPIKKLEEEGFSVTYLSAKENGFILKEQILNAVTKDTCLVSVMAVNNETGAINQVFGLKNQIKQISPNCFFHSDCVQAFLKTPINADDFDLITISGHKVGAPKGVGALIINKEIPGFIFGGGQQKNMRSGTIPTALICAFSAAIKNFNCQNVPSLYNYAIEKLSKFNINYLGPSNKHIINFSVNNIKSETLLHFLESKNIYVSSGSACSKGKKSSVLLDMGLNNSLIDSALRISFCQQNTPAEIDILLNALLEAQSTLIKFKTAKL